MWLKQLWVLLQRSFIDAQRNSKKLLVALVCYLVSCGRGVLRSLKSKSNCVNININFQVPFTAMGLLYTNLTGRTQSNIQDIQGLFFSLTCEIMFSTMYRILNVYLVKTPLLRRETNEKIYSLSAYYVANCLSDMPFLSIRPLFGLIITYNLSGFDKGILFFIQLWLTMIFLAFTANAYGKISPRWWIFQN